jgi:hypothetical protein
MKIGAEMVAPVGHVDVPIRRRVAAEVLPFSWSWNDDTIFPGWGLSGNYRLGLQIGSDSGNPPISRWELSALCPPRRIGNGLPAR